MHRDPGEAGRGERQASGRETLQLPGREDDRGSPFEQPARGRQPDPPAPAGDQGHLAFEIENGFAHRQVFLHPENEFARIEVSR